MAGRAPRISLDQWRALRAVVDHGSFEAAAEALSRSQSSVSYAVRRLQERLPVAVLEHRGRRAVLTEAGEALLRRARALLDEAADLESMADTLAAGWEAELALAADIVCPTEVIMDSLAEFGRLPPLTRVELFESVLSGSTEAIVQREVDLAIAARVPPGFLGEPLLDVEFLAVAHPDHPLHGLARPITDGDLRSHRQVVVRDTGRRRVDSGWLGAEQRWTVSHMRTSVAALREGLGFAWLPRDLIADDLEGGRLAPLPLETGGRRRVTLNLVMVDRDGAGPAARALADILLRRACAHDTRA